MAVEFRIPDALLYNAVWREVEHKFAVELLDRRVDRLHSLLCLVGNVLAPLSMMLNINPSRSFDSTASPCRLSRSIPGLVG